MGQYEFPIDPSWSREEMIVVVEFLNLIEQAYHEGVSRKKLEEHYQAFKAVVNTISGEKRLGREFAQASGYEIYPVVKQLRNKAIDFIKL